MAASLHLKQCCLSIVNHIAVPEDVQVDGEIYGSVGFGLDIVNEVLSAHGSQLHLHQHEGQYAASFELPLSR